MSRLFVYGSLRSGSGHSMHAVLAAAGASLGAARVRGRLYRVDWYPGLVLDVGAGWVQGELWSLHDVDVLPKLDAYEGNTFERVEATAIGAWVYLYVGPTEGLELIANGEWLEPHGG